MPAQQSCCDRRRWHAVSDDVIGGAQGRGPSQPRWMALADAEEASAGSSNSLRSGRRADHHLGLAQLIRRK
jgi:hypothetical protein